VSADTGFAAPDRQTAAGDPTAHPDHRPAVVGSAVAVLAALAATAIVAGRPAQLGALALEAVGLAAVLAATRRDAPSTPLLALAGWLAVAAALGLGATRPERVSLRVELLPGMVGAAVVAASVVAPRRWTRRVVAVGVTCVVLGVLASGVVYGADSIRLLAAAALAVLAWDAGENAVGLGRQVGRDGVTPRVEAVHLGASAVVGALAVAAAVAAAALPLSGIPVAAVLLLLVAVLALVVALWL
jgi:hypothetical protein